MACKTKVGILYTRGGLKYSGIVKCEGECAGPGDKPIECLPKETDGTETRPDGTVVNVVITACECEGRFSVGCRTALVETILNDERVDARIACLGDCGDDGECLPQEVDVEYYPQEEQGKLKLNGGPHGTTYTPGPPAVRVRWYSCDCYM
jgi:hypothetical protein